ncbi:MAG: right-handed parallel beta-helix repeat-containing protein [Geobacteraceae bacterium]|nr:right-handed parallel beta-helix repeat-containing protein [Geobacteraceae bacterium]
MIPCGSFIRIFLFLAFLLCVGCGQSLFSLGKDNEAVSHLTATGQTITAPLPLPAERKPVCYDTGAQYTASYHTSVLKEDVTLSGKVLISGVLTIAPQATLNIVPGTVISFVPDKNSNHEGALVVQGRIAAVGIADKMIVFKAATLDTSQDSWRGIIVLGSEKNNLLDYCRIEGASVGLDSIFSTISLKNTSILSCGIGIRIQGSLFQAIGGSVSDSEVGYVLIDSEASLRDVFCSDNTKGILLSRGSLSVKGSSFSRNTSCALEAVDSKIKVFGATFSKNGTGLALSGSEGTIEASKIVENREYGLQLAHSRMKISGNRIFMNTGVGIMSDTGDSAAWGNTISLNGLYDFYNAGTDDFRAIGNWWGASTVKGQKRRIFDKAVDRSRGSVLTTPELSVPPAGIL